MNERIAPMTFLDARAHYRRTDTGGTLPPESPHAIILVTLRELARSLHVLAAVGDRQSYPSIHVSRAFTAIYILQSSLDFENGGEIAVNLFRVYEYCRLQVAQAFRHEPGPRLAEAAQHIAGLLSAWEQIGGQVERQTA
jgi:flagellar secretion chaperone FliS